MDYLLTVGLCVVTEVGHWTSVEESERHHVWATAAASWCWPEALLFRHSWSVHFLPCCTKRFNGYRKDICFSACTLLVGDTKHIRRVKSWVLVCWWLRFEWSFARLIASVVTTHHLHHP